MNYQQLDMATRRASWAIEQDGGLRSSLRRAATYLDVIGMEAVANFAKALEPIVGQRALENDAIAECTMILMAQRNVVSFKDLAAGASPRSGLLPRKLGEKTSVQRLLSEIRFQRILRASDTDDRLQQMRRAIALLKSKIHPLAVADAYLDLHSEPGRRRFARAYFEGFAEDDGSATAPALVESA